MVNYINNHYLKVTMNKKTNKILTIFLVAVSLSACSSTDRNIKSFMKCGMAATQLEMYTARQNISKKLDQYFIENNIRRSSREIMFLQQDVRDDYALYAKSLQDQVYILVKAYNSSTCREMHEQEKIKMPLHYYLSYIFI